VKVGVDERVKEGVQVFEGEWLAVSELLDVICALDV
jgi:hypothetical protein